MQAISLGANLTAQTIYLRRPGTAFSPRSVPLEKAASVTGDVGTAVNGGDRE
jgi:hypothetical protein